jgi:hypothetical protein
LRISSPATVKGRQTWVLLKVVTVFQPYPRWSQELRYGDRTARGIAEGRKVAGTAEDKKKCCVPALTVWERRRRVKSGKKRLSDDVMIDIGLFRAFVTSGSGKKEGNDHSQSGARYGSLKALGKRGKSWWSHAFEPYKVLCTSSS